MNWNKYVKLNYIYMLELQDIAVAMKKYFHSQDKEVAA
jgi:hypothetical protein